MRFGSKSKDLSPTYLKATQPPSILRQPPSNHLIHVGVQDCKVSIYFVLSNHSLVQIYNTITVALFMSHLRTVLQCVCVRGEEEGTTALGDSFLGKGVQILNIAPT